MNLRVKREPWRLAITVGQLLLFRLSTLNNILINYSCGIVIFVQAAFVWPISGSLNLDFIYFIFTFDRGQIWIRLGQEQGRLHIKKRSESKTKVPVISDINIDRTRVNNHKALNLISSYSSYIRFIWFWNTITQSLHSS